MKKRLHLRINQVTLERAKVYAKKRGISLSLLVQNYLDVLTKSGSSEHSQVDSPVSELVGVIKDPGDVKEEYSEYLRSKYLRA